MRKQRLQGNGNGYATGFWLDNQTISDDRLKEEEQDLAIKIKLDI